MEIPEPVLPKPFLDSLKAQEVAVKLKWGMEYRGILGSVDAYMNFQLLDTEEWIDGTLSGNVGEVLIRCNNVLYVRELNGEEKEARAKRREEQEENGKEGEEEVKDEEKMEED
eukprot:TRINITY_DN3992_c0_g1_i1.p1 TRINITY_DN3992_c0_g1~~TRINITY_DN3992_c0_g1_i1.p1  ORF type:complete len:113 (-),score=48.11 TRINITY_DN3992_c0_g1_i1:174-512(-)